MPLNSPGRGSRGLQVVRDRWSGSELRLGWRVDLPYLEMWAQASSSPPWPFLCLGLYESGFRWEQKLFQWVPGLERGGKI